MAPLRVASQACESHTVPTIRDPARYHRPRALPSTSELYVSVYSALPPQSKVASASRSETGGTICPLVRLYGADGAERWPLVTATGTEVIGGIRAQPGYLVICGVAGVSGDLLAVFEVHLDLIRDSPVVVRVPAQRYRGRPPFASARRPARRRKCRRRGRGRRRRGRAAGSARPGDRTARPGARSRHRGQPRRRRRRPPSRAAARSTAVAGTTVAGTGPPGRVPLPAAARLAAARLGAAPP